MDIPNQITDKILPLDQTIDLIKQWKRNGEKIVFTNGVFDILHPGHMTYLVQALEYGDRLIIGLNSDASVKRLDKGEDRPINNQWSRAILLAALQCTDIIVTFNDETPLELINSIQPDVLVKGGDYDTTALPTEDHYIVGSIETTNAGGSVISIPFLEGYSSSKIINKIRGNHG